ncbi:MAG TPA: DUF308 domain-containing protein [Lachnospiraceae bacterium]|nr:DUF308 domain-containing protein [Lachnospiraceae bacterium]
MVKKMKINTFLVSLLYVVLGVIMILFPKTTMKTICYIFAGILILIGLVYTFSYFKRNIVESYYRYDLVYGLVTILCGVLVISKVDLLIDLIPIVMGLLIFGNGIIKLQHAIDLKRVDFSGWFYVLIFSLLCISIGAVLIVQPAFIAETVTMIIGISFTFSGITDLITLLLLSKKIKDFKNGKAVIIDDGPVDESETVDERNDETDRQDEA